MGSDAWLTVSSEVPRGRHRCLAASETDRVNVVRACQVSDRLKRPDLFPFVRRIGNAVREIENLHGTRK